MIAMTALMKRSGCERAAEAHQIARGARVPGTEKMARTIGYRNVFRPSSADIMALGRELDFKKESADTFLKKCDRLARPAERTSFAARGARVTDAI